MLLRVAAVGGRVEALPVTLGHTVADTTEIVRLSNPDVALAALQTHQQLIQARAALAQLRTRQLIDRTSQQSVLAQVQTQRLDAERTALVADSLNRRGLSSRNEAAAAHDRLREMELRTRFEGERLDAMRKGNREQLAFGAQQVETLERIEAEQRRRIASLRVGAGQEGILQSLGAPRLELGAWVNSGAELARIVKPGRLRAQLRIPEAQAKDVIVGLAAEVDTHDGVVPGRVAGIDPALRNGAITVEIAFDRTLPTGARPDGGVEGVIILERLPRLTHLGRPAYGRAGGTVRLFRIVPNSGRAERVDVQLGRTTSTRAEIISGLAVGDSVVISDMSPYITETSIRLKTP
ncbi:MAG: HlyD family efflux transporter periplasmic adaptor subunit [Gemmatimonadaceae bacterium]|nr:HlyD family efflux transporter periplasmic adaptor subunit [Gemmatimonadaceae bacterium]